MLLQEPPHAADADAVLLSKLPAGSTGFEGGDDRVYLGIVQPVGKTPLPEAGSYGADTAGYGWLTACERLAELACLLV